MELLDWFEWNGVRCTELGMHVLQQPSIMSPVERVEDEEVPGRAGSLSLLEGEHVYKNLTLSCTCVIDEPYMVENGERVSRISKITGWLKGSGTVKFANRQEGFYRARLSNQISFDKIVRGNPHMSFQVQFTCEPFFYLDSGLISQTIVETTTLTNPGNVFSLPLLKIRGTGEGTIMCGGSSILLSDISDLPYIMLDCEARVAYKGSRTDPSDPLTLLGMRAQLESQSSANIWPNIPAGWSAMTITGNITSVEITPRWRCV